MFDDDAVGLKEEPFVSGAPEVIDMLVADMPGADAGFALYFSDRPFPQYQVKLDWLKEEYGGNWYRTTETGMEGWLCPAMLKYFDQAPVNIYARAEAIKKGEGPGGKG